MNAQHKADFDEAIEAIKLAYFKLNTLGVDPGVALKVAYDTWVQTKPPIFSSPFGYPSWVPMHNEPSVSPVYKGQDGTITTEVPDLSFLNNPRCEAKESS